MSTLATCQNSSICSTCHLPPTLFHTYTSVIFHERYQPIHKLAFNVCNVMFFRQFQHFTFVSFLFRLFFIVVVLTFSRYFIRPAKILRCRFCCLFYSFHFVPFDSVLCYYFFFYCCFAFFMLRSPALCITLSISLRFYCYF